ncbi:DUF4337 domain-containing protein [Siccirubricoccus sp. KC 17139]|uniref:DUF4337 domain-containing protein n=1 Tax=Siccirubricoccus soli TaxID=2899147 RepID=A0ABT1D0S3_9PROT|nr:DUF4337 domain-containing protein [Siccirubricoccus soli]MCO6415523.1 DUF4337 domain-containing protein [Siccirubricoccus soli]MCP2681655.1 DUF4337 domain-containing protein [Siccirubricoccus soli]
MAGHGHADHGGDKRIALLISILALFLAISETGAKSAQTEAISRNVEAANLWAFFQSRTVRQTTVRTAAEEAELARLAATDEAVRGAIERQQRAWRDSAQRWESEPETGEGRRELMNRARAAEHHRDVSMAAYHHYEYASAAFQVAIVMASSSIVTGVPALAVAGGVVGLVGVALTGIGYFAPEAVHF